ncbi:MAG TPA: tyrosine-type recombinase/integrase [Stellaceae bacterium]|nr:tyrosine-type recombinase/integrase [Stellaceae bacterium]
MPQVKLTVRNAPTLPAPAEGFIEYFDLGLPGFGIRVSSKGRRTWLVRYRIKGRKGKGSMSLGTVGSTEFADARGAAKDALRAAEKGIDPAEPVRRERHAETFKELADRYIEEYAKGPDYKDGKGKPRKRSWKTDQRIIKRDLVPVIGNMKALTVKRADLRPILRAVIARGAPIMANRVHEVLRMIFAWAISEEIGGIEHNPCDGLARPSEEHSRDRVLSTGEIKTLWKALSNPPAGMPRRCALALKLQLVTAQRKGEVVGAEWSEIDRKAEKVWTIPAEKAKNRLAHRVPLTDSALDVLGEIEKLAGKSRWLFPSPSGDKPMTARAINHAVLRVVDKLGVGDDMRPHDLRRSAASHMASIGISRFIIARILNHVERGVTAVYDRHSYDREKLQALDAWGRRLEQIVSSTAPPSNVTELRRA